MNDPNELMPIIIADDHKMIIDGIKSMLQGEEKYPVLAEAHDGAAALAMIASEPEKYKLLLTDISMPLMTGTELCKRVKAKYPHIKVLVLSMYNSHSVIKEAIAADADGYILKNTGKDEFIAALQRISDNSIFFSEEIMPIMHQLYQRDQVQDNTVAGLSAHEREVLSLIVKELTSVEIAQKLSLSKDAVSTYRADLLDKTDSKSTIGLMRFAIKNGLCND